MVRREGQPVQWSGRRGVQMKKWAEESGEI